MGYYTCYNLDVNTQNEDVVMKVEDWLDKMELYGLDSHGFCSDFYDETNFGCVDSMKWSDWEEDMRKLSLSIPGVTFCLHGEGEDPDDFWDAYFLNGECEFCPGTRSIPRPTKIPWEVTPFNKDLRNKNLCDTAQ